jgi:hypothetical protein
MKINLVYGDGHLPGAFPDERTTVIARAHRPGLPDERAALTRSPLAASLRGRTHESFHPTDAARRRGIQLSTNPI